MHAKPSLGTQEGRGGEASTARCRGGPRTWTSSRATWGGASVCLKRVRIQSIFRMCSSFRFARSSAMLSCVRSDRIAVSLEKLGAGIALCVHP